MRIYEESIFDQRPLAEIALVNPKVNKAEIPPNGEITFVPMASVTERLNQIDISRLRPFREVEKGYTPFISGDVLFAKVTPCMENGKIALVPELRTDFGFGSTEFHVLRSKGNLHPKLLFYFLVSDQLRGEAARHMTGAVGLRRVPTSFLETIQIPVPPQEIQYDLVCKIEELFSKIELGSDELVRTKENLALCRQSVLSSALRGELQTNDPSDESITQLLERIQAEKVRLQKSGKSKKEKPLPPIESSEVPFEIPQGWVWVRLRDLAQIKGGIAKDAGKSPLNAKMLPYLRVANVQRGKIDLSHMKEILVPEEKLADLRLEAGDVLFNEGGDRDKLGRGWVWEGEIADCVHQNHVFRARPYAKAISPYWISHYGNTFGKEYFLKFGKQTTNLASISMTVLGLLPIPVPPVGVQQRTLDRLHRLLSVIDETDASVTKQLNEAEMLKQSVLKSVFEGKLK